MRRIASIVVVLAALAFAPSALADHQHWMETPAGCREDVAKGQTRKGENEPGGHKFHDNVHTGTPGEHAFANERNPVRRPRLLPVGLDTPGRSREPLP